MFHIVLYEPEIPPNTGNIIRLCSNVGAQLHLIKPLGFDLSEKKVRRAGLDYRDIVDVKIHENFASYLQQSNRDRLFACSTKGKATYVDVAFKQGDAFLFGPETRGLPLDILTQFPSQQILRLPMLPNNRSLNLSNAVSIFVYEAWRQTGFAGAI